MAGLSKVRSADDLMEHLLIETDWMATSMGWPAWLNLTTGYRSKKP